MIDLTAPPIETRTDRWCVNCARMIAPKRAIPPLAWVLGVMAGGSTYLSFHGGNWFAVMVQSLAAWDWAFAGAATGIVAGILAAIGPALTCPICGSANLLLEHPGPHS